MGRMSSTVRTTAWNSAIKSSFPHFSEVGGASAPGGPLRSRFTPGHEVRPERMSLANKVSIFRILLVPSIIACLVYYHPDRDWLRFVSLGLFVVGMASDALDGLIARLHNQQTELGTLLDPIADKLLILGTLISCSVIRGLPESMRVPAWFNLVVISRDVLLVAGAVVLFVITGRWNVRPSRLGKWTTFTQMLVIPIVLLGLPSRMPMLAAAVLTVLSAVNYIRVGIRVLS